MIAPYLLRNKKNCVSHYRTIAALVLLLLFGLAACSSDPITSQPSTAQAQHASSQAPTTQVASVAATLTTKPLHLPAIAAGAQCPTTAGQEHISPDRRVVYGTKPVYLVGSTSNGVLPYTPPPFIGDTTSRLGGSRVLWEITPAYTGPILIRGQQIDGPDRINFNGGLTQGKVNSQGTTPVLPALNLRNTTTGQWSTWVTYTRLKTPGCYAYQVDGLTFSEVIVFKAVAA